MLSIFFYGFSALLLMAACSVVFFNNTVFSILSLLVVFIATAGLWLLLGAEFLALALIFIYVGAVIVLFLCAVMLFNLSHQKTQVKPKILLPGAIFSLFLAIIMIYLVTSQHFERLIASQTNNTKAIGDILYTNYWLALVVSGIVLLVAVIGVIKLINGKQYD